MSAPIPTPNASRNSTGCANDTTTVPRHSRRYATSWCSKMRTGMGVAIESLHQRPAGEAQENIFESGPAYQCTQWPHVALMHVFERLLTVVRIEQQPVGKHFG